MPGDLTRGLLDTNIVILRHDIDPDELPDEMAISAVTLAELSAGVHLVSGETADAIDEIGDPIEDFDFRLSRQFADFFDAAPMPPTFEIGIQPDPDDVIQPGFSE